VEYIQELGRLLREDTEFGLAYFNFYCLSSVRSMSQWTFEDMALTGCSTVFVGVESKFAGDHGYAKKEGVSHKETFDGLHRVGISTTGAWMVGFDFQTRENIEEDLQDFIDLYPSLQQLTRVCPFPPTPIWKMLKDEGRIREDFKWEEVSFYGGGGMVLSNFYEHEIMEIIERGYRLLYETHGASIVRMLHVNLMGYEYFMENRRRNRYFEDRALYHKKLAYAIFPILKAAEIYAPNSTVRKKMKDIRRMYIRLCGEPTEFQKMLEHTLTLRSGMARLQDLLNPADNRLTEEAFKKYIYDKPGPAYPECPYRVVYPHRTRRFSLNLQAKANLRRAVAGMERIGRIAGRSRQDRPDKGVPIGSFEMFL
jgi:hypothetical protein